MLLSDFTMSCHFLTCLNTLKNEAYGNKRIYCYLMTRKYYAWFNFTCYPPPGQPRGQVLPFGTGGGELSLSACPGVGNRPPSESKIANPRGYSRGGMVTGRIEPCIKLPHLSSRQFIATIRSFIQRFIRT